MSDRLFVLLIVQFWQVVVVFAVVYLLNRWLAKDRPHWAHALWVLVLVKCITPPIWSSPASPFYWAPSIGNSKSSEVAKTQSNLRSEADVVVAPSVFPPNVVYLNQSIESNEDNSVSSKSRPATSDNRRSTTPTNTRAKWKPSKTLSSFLVLAWIGGVVFVFLIWGIRFGVFLRKIAKEKDVSNSWDDLKQMVSLLAQQFGIRRQVRVRVLRQPFGPAVFGIVRPIILLPEQLIKGKTAEQLKPLLAHELIHIRRGDLWWALLQTMANSLLWFHPLVWWASRSLTRESERSCDEETIASLDCRPASYARSLLDVLEFKHRLYVAPALPGVRPVDITSARLERVMRLGKENRKRTPLKVWLTTLFLGAIMLPGAAATLPQPTQVDMRQQEQSSETLIQNWPKNENDNFEPSRLPKVSGNQDGLVFDQPAKPMQDQPSTSIHLVGDLLAKLRDVKIAEGHTPESFLIDCITPIVKHPDGKLGRQPVQIINEDQLLIHGTVEQKKAIGRLLSQFRQHGFQTVVSDVWLVSVEPDRLNDLQIDWEISTWSQAIGPSNNESIDPLLPAKTDTRSASVSANGTTMLKTTLVQTSQPILFASLSEKQRKVLLDHAKGDIQMNIVQAPTVTAFNGQQAVIRDGVERPFVIGLQRAESAIDKLVAQPVVKVIQEGTRITLTPKINGDEIMLNCDLSFQMVRDVISKGYRLEGHTDIVTLQVPQIAKTELQTTQKLKNGSTLAICCEWPTEVRQHAKLIQKNQQGVVLIKCQFKNELAPPGTENAKNVDIQDNPLLNDVVKVDQVVIGPVTTGNQSTAPLTVEEFRMALARQKNDAERLLNVNNATIEEYESTVDSPREVPLIGRAQLRRTVYKCVVCGQFKDGMVINRTFLVEKHQFHMLD